MTGISTYDIQSKYKWIPNEDSWGMDVRHILILHNMLLFPYFSKVLEIGTHYGLSTTAFIEANIKRDDKLEIHLCDIKFEDSARRLCQEIANVSLHELRSSDYLQNSPKFDFALLDGSHIAEDVEDEFEYLCLNGIDTLMLHDVNTQLLPENKDTPWYDGPMFLKQKLMASPDWLCLEDSLFREGERTERGLFFATTKKIIYDEASTVFEYFKHYEL